MVVRVSTFLERTPCALETERHSISARRIDASRALPPANVPKIVEPPFPTSPFWKSIRSLPSRLVHYVRDQPPAPIVLRATVAVPRVPTSRSRLPAYFLLRHLQGSQPIATVDHRWTADPLSHVAVEFAPSHWPAGLRQVFCAVTPHLVPGPYLLPPRCRPHNTHVTMIDDQPNLHTYIRFMRPRTLPSTSDVAARYTKPRYRCIWPSACPLKRLFIAAHDAFVATKRPKAKIDVRQTLSKLARSPGHHSHASRHEPIDCDWLLLPLCIRRPSTPRQFHLCTFQNASGKLLAWFQEFTYSLA